MKMIYKIQTLFLLGFISLSANSTLLSSSINVSNNGNIYNDFFNPNGAGTSGVFGQSQIGVTDGALFARTRTEAYCSYDGDELNKIQSGEECFAGISASASFEYQIDVTPTVEGFEFLTSQGLSSFDVFFDYTMYASYQRTLTFDELGNTNRAADGGVSGRLTFNTNVIDTVRGIFNDTDTASGTVQTSVSANGGSLVFNFSAASTAYATIGSRAYGVNAGIVTEAFVDPIVYVDSSLTDYIDIEVAVLDVPTLTIQQGQLPTTNVSVTNSFLLFAFGLILLAVKRLRN